MEVQNYYSHILKNYLYFLFYNIFYELSILGWREYMVKFCERES